MEQAKGLTPAERWVEYKETRQWQKLAQAETRLWISVIFEALNDLNQDNAAIREEAKAFIEGRNGSLQCICRAVGLNHVAIISMYKKLGALEMKKLFVNVLRKKSL